MTEPEKSLDPPEPPPERRFTDWTCRGWLSVEARTPEEAAERLAKVEAAVNAALAVDGFRGAYGAILQIDLGSRAEA